MKKKKPSYSRYKKQRRKANSRRKLKTFANSDPIKVISSRFRYIKIPEPVKQAVLKDVTKWYNHNGPDYTVKKLKYVRQCLIHYMADGSLPPVHNEVWFKKNSKGLLYGHWSTLFKLTKVNPKEVLKLVTCYTVFAVDGDPTEKQIQSFKTAVQEPFKGDATKLSAFDERLYKHAKHIVRRYISSKHVFKDIKPPKNYWIYARANNEGHKTDMVTQVLDLTSNAEFHSMVSKMPWVEQSFSINLEALKPPVIPKEFRVGLKGPIMGHVQWLHEPGMKERIITDFKKPLEHLTMPLGKRLYEIVSLVPWDSTFHEERGYTQIQRALKDGKKAYCFDLSKATDRFPFSTQMAVMLSLDLGPNYLDQLEILEYAVSQDALLPNYERVRWEVGQPMGYYPSFAMFSLTHGLVLMEYLYSHGIEYKGQFIVHGDDLVILDDELADFYKEFIKFSGCDMNEFKTVISYNFAEFNSRLVLKDSFIQMRKWRPITLASLFDQLPEWGPKAIDWVNDCGKRVKDLLRLILSIPDVMPNGNSINPEGLSKQMRLDRVHEAVLEVLFTKPAAKSNFVSFRNLVLDRFRRNHFIQLDIDICDLLATNIVLQSHLEALNLADNLDKGLLLDLFDFVDYMTPFTAPHNHLMRNTQVWGGHDAVGWLLPLVGSMLADFNDAFSPGEKLFTFSFIKQLDTARRNTKTATSKLYKTIEVCKSLETPFYTSACESEIA